MKISLQWLRDYIPSLNIGPTDVSQHLTSVGLEVEKITRSQIFFRQHILRGNALAADGWDELISGKVQIVCVSVDAGQMKVTSIPSAMRSQLEALQ